MTCAAMSPPCSVPRTGVGMDRHATSVAAAGAPGRRPRRPRPVRQRRPQCAPAGQHQRRAPHPGQADCRCPGLGPPSHEPRCAAARSRTENSSAIHRLNSRLRTIRQGFTAMLRLLAVAYAPLNHWRIIAMPRVHTTIGRSSLIQLTPLLEPLASMTPATNWACGCGVHFLLYATTQPLSPMHCSHSVAPRLTWCMPA